MSAQPKTPLEQKETRPKIYEMDNKFTKAVIDNSNDYQKKTGNTERTSDVRPQNPVGIQYQELLHRGRGVSSCFFTVS
jgi:hypothetical protein